MSAPFVYQAPASCPPEADFRQRVARWLLDPAASALAEGDLRLEASPAEQEDHAYQGHASLPRSGAARDLHAATCEELVTAFAFVFAVDLDERVLERKKPESLPLRLAPPPRSPPKSSLPTLARAADRRHLEASLAVLTGAGAGLLPHATPLEGLEVEARSSPDRDRAADAGFSFSPRLRLGLALDAPAEATASSAAPEATARFIGLRVRLDACPFALMQSIVDVSLCARAETDLIFASGVDLAASRGATDVLFGLGGSARVAIRVASRWSVGVDGGLVAPVERDRFTAFQGHDSLYATSLLTGSAQAFVAWRFH